MPEVTTFHLVTDDGRVSAAVSTVGLIGKSFHVAAREIIHDDGTSERNAVDERGDLWLLRSHPIRKGTMHNVLV